ARRAMARLFKGRMAMTGFMRAAAVIACAVAAAPTANAQSGFPNKPIKIVVGFAPGGPSDIIARIVGAKTAEMLGQQVVIENKTGAGGLIAGEAVARAEPDGY